MLLKSPWMKSLSDACETIPEEPDEDGEHEESDDDSEDDGGVEAATNGVQSLSVTAAEPGVHDPVVAEWARAALERRARSGNGEKLKPALHAAPLDQVSPGLMPLGGMRM